MIVASIIAVLVAGALIVVVLTTARLRPDALTRWFSTQPADDYTEPSDRTPEQDGAEVIDLSSYEPRTPIAPLPELDTIDLRGAQTWHIGSTHPSLGLGADQQTEGHGLERDNNPALTLIDGGGETTVAASGDGAGELLRVVDHEPHTYFELINLMDWAAHRDPSSN